MQKVDGESARGLEAAEDVVATIKLELLGPRY